MASEAGIFPEPPPFAVPTSADPADDAVTTPTPDLRTRLVAALDQASRTHPCTCGRTIWAGCFHPGAPTHSERRADAVLGVVQPELDQLRSLHGVYEAAKIGNLIGLDAESAVAVRGIAAETKAELHRYRLAYLSARQRAEAYGEGILRHVEDRDTWKGWMRQQEARAIAAEQQLAAIRAYADDLYTAPQKVSACGVRERLLDMLTPTGPTRTIEAAMAGQPLTPKPCEKQYLHDPHTWTEYRREHHCTGDLTYTTTKET